MDIKLEGIEGAKKETLSNFKPGDAFMITSGCLRAFGIMLDEKGDDDDNKVLWLGGYGYPEPPMIGDASQTALAYHVTIDKFNADFGEPIEGIDLNPGMFITGEGDEWFRVVLDEEQVMFVERPGRDAVYNTGKDPICRDDYYMPLTINSITLRVVGAVEKEKPLMLSELPAGGKFRFAEKKYHLNNGDCVKVDLYGWADTEEITYANSSYRVCTTDDHPVILITDDD